MSLTLDRPKNIALAVDQCISNNKGDQLAIRYRDKRYSYNDLAALMNRAGNMLKRFNVGAGDRVLIAVSMSPSLVASVLGAMKIGATAVIVPNEISSSVSAKLKADSKLKLLIVDAGRLPVFETVKAGIEYLIVGEADNGQHSFVGEMRASASSLSQLPSVDNVAALAIADADKLIFLNHDQIDQVGLFGSSDIGKALVRLARGEDVSIPK